MSAVLIYVFACEILIRGTEWLIRQNVQSAGIKNQHL